MKSSVDFANQVKQYTAAGKGIAPVENGETAVGSYAIGDQFMREGVLYKAKTDIDAGDSLVLDTNYELEDDVTTQLSSVKQALTNEAEVRAKAGAHNYLRNDVETHTDSSNYTTYTKNADKSVEVTRTSSSGTYSISYVLYQVAGSIPKGNYILTGCPSGGASNTYKLDISVYSADRSTSYGTYTDTGNGVNVNIPADDCSIDCRIVIYPAVASGGTFSKTFYPMLADAKDAYKGYLPFAPTNAQCLSADANAVLGAHNFFVNTDVDRTISGIAITRNNDNSYNVAAGTTSGSGLQFPIKMDSNYDDFEKIADALLPNTTYVFSVGVADANISLQVYSWEDDPSVTTTLANATNVSEVSFTTPATFKHIYARIYVPISTAVPAMTLKPIIKLASDPSNKLTPYAMTNQQLTDVARKKVLISSSTSLNDCIDQSTTYYITGANVPLYAPESDAYNALIWNFVGDIYTIQFYASSNKKALYFRFKAGNPWGAWQKITSSELT